MVTTSGSFKKLSGVRKGNIPASFFRSVSDVEEILNAGYAATAAGKKGSITVWNADNGTIKFTYHELNVTTEEGTVNALDTAMPWIESRLVRIELEADSEDDQ